jgi:hypothetical protein
MSAQPTLEQTVEDRAADVATARTDLRVAATALDRLNKRFFSKTGCAAYGLASDYLKGSPIRQEYLETAIAWHATGRCACLPSLPREGKVRQHL